MNSPRFLRPHSVKILRYIEENEAGERVDEVLVLNHVKWQGKESVDPTTKKDRVTDEFIITIDCSDTDGVEIPPLVPDLDRVQYRDEIYTVISFVEINPFENSPEFIEITCRKS